MKEHWPHLPGILSDMEGAEKVLEKLNSVIVNIENEEDFMKSENPLEAAVDQQCQEKLPDFIAINGTARSRFIHKNAKAMQTVFEVKYRVPTILLELDGSGMYDEGIGEAWLELFKVFPERNWGLGQQITGILGADELDANLENFAYLPEESRYIYDLDQGINYIQKASTVWKNLVVSPSGIKSARYFQKRFGIPYEVGYPVTYIEGYETCLAKIQKMDENADGPLRILILHQQVLANSLRKEFRKYIRAHFIVASCFTMDKEGREPWDLFVPGEEEWIRLVEEGKFDLILCDPLMAELVKDDDSDKKHAYQGLNHPAVSGQALKFVEN